MLHAEYPVLSTGLKWKRYHGRKAKLTMRKAYGFKTLKCLKIALYHTLGELPEPHDSIFPLTHVW